MIWRQKDCVSVSMCMCVSRQTKERKRERGRSLEGIVIWSGYLFCICEVIFFHVIHNNEMSIFFWTEWGCATAPHLKNRNSFIFWMKQNNTNDFDRKVHGVTIIYIDGMNLNCASCTFSSLWFYYSELRVRVEMRNITTCLVHATSKLRAMTFK